MIGLGAAGPTRDLTEHAEILGRRARCDERPLRRNPELIHNRPYERWMAPCTGVQTQSVLDCRADPLDDVLRLRVVETHRIDRETTLRGVVGSDEHARVLIPERPN